MMQRKSWVLFFENPKFNKIKKKKCIQTLQLCIINRPLHTITALIVSCHTIFNISSKMKAFYVNFIRHMFMTNFYWFWFLLMCLIYLISINSIMFIGQPFNVSLWLLLELCPFDPVQPCLCGSARSIKSCTESSAFWQVEVWRAQVAV